MLTLTVSNKITIHNLANPYAAVVRKTLTIQNKDYHKLRRMGIAAPLEFKFYREANGDLIIPRGCYGRLRAFLDNSGLDYSVSEQLVDTQSEWSNKQILLRDYQQPIVDNIVEKLPQEGIIVASTGSGKTIMALELMRRLGLCSTVLVPNTVLLNQFAEEYKNFFGHKPGIIDATHKEIGTNLTVATFQSLASNKTLRKTLAAQTALLLIDECHGAVSNIRRKVIESFAPKHLFGLTATAERSDSLTDAIFLLLGKPIAEHQATMLTPQIEVFYTGFKAKSADSYLDMVEEMVQNKSRNTLIAGLLTGELLQGRKVLVITKRIAHYQALQELLPAEDGIFYIDSSDPARNGLLTAFKTGLVPFKAILGTTSLLSVGTDISALDTLIIACDMKSSVLTTQTVGRILRLFDGKQQPKIIDLHDNQTKIFSRQFYERFKLYRQKGWIT